MQKVKLFQEFRLDEATPGLNVTPKGVTDGVFSVAINGHDYGYEAKEDGPSLNDVVSSFKGMLKHSAGRALAYLKKNTTLASGSKKNEAEDLSSFGLFLNENNVYIVEHVKMFEQFTNSLIESQDDIEDEIEDEEDEDMNEELTAGQKKLPPGLQKAILAKQGKKPKKEDEDKDDDKKDDKKGDKKSDKKDDKDDEEKESKSGLTAGQKKLPEGLQKAILAKQKKNESEIVNLDEKEEKKDDKKEEKKDDKKEDDDKKEKKRFFANKDLEKSGAKLAIMGAKIEGGAEKAISELKDFLKNHPGELPPSHKTNIKDAIELLKDEEKDEEKAD